MLIRNRNIFGIVFLLSFLIVSSVKAFTVSPLKYTVSLAPNDSHDYVVSVQNDSNINKEYQAVVVGLQQDQLGRSIFKNDSDIAENWIKFNSEKITLKNDEKKDFVFTINIPKNTPPGAHYLGIGAQEVNEKNISGRLMTIVVLQVAGTANESLLLEKFNPINRYFFNKNLVYYLQFKNVGNIDLALKSQIQIYDFKNKLISTVPVDLGNKLFAQSVRAADIRPDVSKEIFWPGKYRSMIIINFGLTKQQVISSANFYYLPTWFLYLIGIVIFLVISLVIYRKKKHERMV